MSASNNTPQDKLVQVFAKAPVAGKVKTRLIPALGEQGAVNLHKQLTQTLLANLCGPRFGDQASYDCELWISDAEPEAGSQSHNHHPFFERCQQSYSLPLRKQQGQNLGDRMFAAIEAGLETHKKVLIVGADCVSVDRTYVEEAFQALNEADVVIGPASDGGYVLIASRVPVKSIFAEVSWGSDQVLQQTLANLAGSGLSYKILDERWDIDEPGDLHKLDSMRLEDPFD